MKLYGYLDDLDTLVSELKSVDLNAVVLPLEEFVDENNQVLGRNMRARIAGYWDDVNGNIVVSLMNGKDITLLQKDLATRFPELREPWVEA